MNTGRRLLSGMLWTYGGQVIAVLAQFVYAGITSRLLDSVAFGAYAIALSATSFITLIATGGLGQSVGRMTELSRDRLAGLVSYGAALGIAAALATYLTAPFWAALWGSSESTELIQLLAINALTAPLFGMMGGIARRLGKFKQLAIVTLIMNLVGMALGILAAASWQSAAALLVLPIFSQVATLVTGLAITNGLMLRLGSVPKAWSDVSYSWKLTGSSVLAYLVGNISKIGTTRILGSAILGQWNRSEVVASIPFQQLQAALIAAVYPEFRHDIDNSFRARTVWTDMLALAAWLVLPLSGVVATTAPAVIPVLFGPGWELAAQFSSLLALAAGLQVVSTLLASAIESLGRFTWIWLTQATLIAVQILAVVWMFLSHDPFILPIALIATNLVRHSIHVAFCARSGYVQATKLLRDYLMVSLATAVTASCGALSVVALQSATRGDWPGSLIALPTIGVAALLVLFWRRLPPVRLARKYRLI